MLARTSRIPKHSQVISSRQFFDVLIVYLLSRGSFAESEWHQKHQLSASNETHARSIHARQGRILALSPKGDNDEHR